MESRLRGGFEVYYVTLAIRCLFACLRVSGQRGIITFKSDFTYEEHLCAVALTGSARRAHTHPLASNFLVRSPMLFVYFQVNTGVFSFLYYVEDICLVALSDPPQTFNTKKCIYPLYLTYTLLLLIHPRQREGLRVLERCYKERIMRIIA